MHQPTNSSLAQNIFLERQLLAALCQNATSDSTRQTILARLQVHRFADPDNEITFRAISALPALPPDQLRPALLNTAMRLGFPELDLTPFFDVSVVTDVIGELLSRL